LTTLVKLGLARLGLSGSYIFYPLGVVAAAWVGGFSAGATAAIASACAGKLFEAPHTFAFKDTAALIHWLMFLGQELLMATIIEALHRARAHAEVARDERRAAQTATQELLEREQSARRESEIASRLKDDFLATMSHELRTPLSAILGWAAILRRKDLDGATRERALDVIERNASAQARLIDDVLDVSRIIRGSLRLRTEPVDVATFLNEALNVVRPAADAKGVVLVPRIDASVGIVGGDPDRLQQVAWNLLANAVKFTPRGGRIEVGAAREGAHVVITVKDTGSGIRPSLLPHVFDRFRQGDASTTRTHGGLGLGLAIVRHLVELHGGTASAASDGDDSGACFTVQLPAPEAVPPAATPSPAAGAVLVAEVDEDDGAALRGLKVVVVDDETDARDLLGTLLRNAGVDVTTVSTASEGVLAVTQHLPDILVSDIGMPQEDGYSLMRRIRSLPAHRGGHTRALALTAYARPEDVSRALAAGFQRHVPKPIAPGQFLAAVAALAGGTPSLGAIAAAKSAG
jgi:signal transduction histidine kinase/CheY-like chemotaxis protein